MSDVNGQHQASPMKGRGRGRGRGGTMRAANTRATVKKPTATGRRGRQKIYEDAKPQAALERQKELKTAFATVAAAMKPALEELADRNINLLKDSPDSIKLVDAYKEIEARLDQRYKETRSHAQIECQLKTNTAAQRERLDNQIARDKCSRGIEEMSEDKLDEFLLQLDILEELHDQGLPVDLRHDSVEYRELEASRRLGSHVVYNKDGIEVPCHKTQPVLTRFNVAPKTPSKRKAELEPEGQPTPKRPTSAMDENGPTSLAPRHIGGLLSAVAPPDDDSASRADESKMPSPAPAPASPEAASEGGSGPDTDTREVSAPGDAVLPDNEKLPTIPNGASEPDAYGVRVVNKRRMVNTEHYNRIMVPPLFEFEEHEIGFRDSTNDKSRGATRAKRGKYLNTPNTNYWHIDRSLWQYDATRYAEDELDQEMVEKYGLHPTMGIFLESSRNPSESPGPIVSGKNPVVFKTADGKILETSRSIRQTEIEARIKQNESKRQLKAAMLAFGQQEGIDLEDIAPDPAVVHQHFLTRMDGYVGQPRSPTPPLQEPEEVEEEEDRVGAHSAVSAILEAAELVATEEQKAQNAKRAAAATRKFDPVRDVFMASEEAAPAPAPVPVEDTRKLADLASVALSDLYVADPRNPHHSYIPVDTIEGEVSFERGGPPDAQTGPQQPSPSFLQTALNPTNSYQPSGPSAYGAMDLAGLPRPSDMPMSRVPFSNPGQAKGVAPPGLPPLRPARGMRALTEEPSPEPGYGSPRPSMVVTNSGNFFPTGPPRAFHSGHTLPEHGQHGLPGPPPMSQGLPPPPPGYMYGPPPPLQPYPPSQQQQMPNQGPYSMSPPFPGPAQLAQGTPMDTPPRPESQHGYQSEMTPPPQQQRISFSAPSSAQQPPSSSNANNAANAANAAAAAKYRKLQPAPVPAHRVGWTPSGPELRTVQYDYRENIKDYSATEAPPMTGPTQIRGWAHNNVRRPRASSRVSEGAVSASAVAAASSPEMNNGLLEDPK